MEVEGEIKKLLRPVKPHWCALMLKYHKVKISTLTAASESDPFSVAPQETKEATPVEELNSLDGCLYRAQPPTAACGPLPCGDVSSAESEPDLAVLCQTNTPM